MLTTQAIPEFTLAPSDFAWLLDDCAACYWYKHRAGLRRPEVPPTRLFSLIDHSMKDELSGKHLGTFGPAGIVREKSQKVLSKPIQFEGINVVLRITGFPDTVIDLDGGGVAVSDSKTSLPSASSMLKYARQLHSYAYALENPEKHDAVEVRELGILAFNPTGFAMNFERSAGSLGGGLTWTPIEKNVDGFLASLAKAARILESPTPPQADPECKYCAHAAALAKILDAPPFMAKQPAVPAADDGDEPA